MIMPADRRSLFFLLAALAFILHQVLQKGLHISVAWADAYLDNVVAPILLMEILRVEKLFRRSIAADFRYSDEEILAVTLFLALASEYLLPLLRPSVFTCDVWDLAAYGGGGLIYRFAANKKSGVRSRADLKARAH